MHIVAKIVGTLAVAGMLAACQTKHQVDVQPVEIKPIHIKIDVNVRIEKALDDFFGEIDEAEQEIKADQKEK